MERKAETSEWIEVRKSGVHGTGVFAAKKIPRGTKVIEYVGEKISKKESDKRADEVLDKAKKNPELGGVYIFELNKRWDIDGNVSWNTARFINHSCDPNCETEIEDGKIWIVAMKDIAKGEELSYNYGYDIDDFEEHPCNCGAKNCVGYILNEKFWGKLKKKVRKYDS